MAKNLSFAKVLEGIVQNDDIPGLQSLVDQHKNWGAFTVRVPSYIVVGLIDALRVLREHGAQYYEQRPDPNNDPLDSLNAPTDAELEQLSYLADEESTK